MFRKAMTLAMGLLVSGLVGGAPEVAQGQVGDAQRELLTWIAKAREGLGVASFGNDVGLTRLRLHRRRTFGVHSRFEQCATFRSALVLS
jgi:hypothetical protein